MTTRQQRVEKCRCCPYGFHIDVDFVAYAEDVRKGGQSRTPTLSRKHGDRLMSPLDSIFSDSLENILSDFDDALGASQAAKASRTLPRDTDAVTNARRMQNGYASDYTGYYSSPAYTALGRTITEIKARNTESPFPEREIGSRVGSRVGTPIDLGVPSYNGNASLSRPRTPHRLEAERDQKIFSESPLERPYQLSSSPSTNTWRRIPIEDRTAMPEPRTNGGSGPKTEFASLRRGREYAVSDTENAHRVRYYSASPKMPRKLQAVPPLPSASQFTYTHNNGNTMLAKTQGTSMSPKPEEEKVILWLVKRGL
ncbi:hypothetical protein ANCCAN_09373 [Ancylostoma caninum]|uniref:Uncharacterized protein n=1 Tax=Ancylostoma caninum TaxID=29170 RepID=A0A368GJQ7_ANCCA|nr:hypothetical protein ANCCAN_09373 [Ancylostoma caninum]